MPDFPHGNRSQLIASTPLPAVDPSLDRLQWSSNGGTQDSMLSTCFVETAKLVIIMQRVMISMYSPRAKVSQVARSGKISELSLALDSWLEQLPTSLCISSHPARTALPHVIMLHLAWEWLIILLYRPIYRPIVGLGGGATRADISAYAVKVSKAFTLSTQIRKLTRQRCDRSSARIVTLLKLYHSLYDIRFVPPTLLNVAFIAGTTHLLAAAHHRSSKMREDALRGANECIRHLRLTGVSWRAAADKANVLQSLLDEYQPPSHLDRHFLGSSEDISRAAEPLVAVRDQPSRSDPQDQSSVDLSWLDACLSDQDMAQWQFPSTSDYAHVGQSAPPDSRPHHTTVSSATHPLNHNQQ